MDKQAPSALEATRVIQALGGPSAISKLLGGPAVITPQAISQWKTNGIPKGWRSFLMTKHAKAFVAPAGQGA